MRKNIPGYPIYHYPLFLIAEGNNLHKDPLLLLLAINIWKVLPITFTKYAANEHLLVKFWFQEKKLVSLGNIDWCKVYISSYALKYISIQIFFLLT